MIGFSATILRKYQQNKTHHFIPKLASLMVWPGVTLCERKTRFVFIDQGFKINQQVYLDMLKNTVVSWVEKTMGDNRIAIQQDRATSRTAKLVQRCYLRNFEEF